MIQNNHVITMICKWINHMFNLLISYHNKFMVNNYKMIKLVNNIGYKIVNIQLIYLLI